MASLSLISIVVSTAIEDTLVDWLLERDGVPGFTSMPINGHGSSVRSLSLKEQVSGSKRQILFQIYLPSEQARLIIEALKQDFMGSGLHYWLVPVEDAGRLE
jgi:nitrogen regulatory protein PII